jgi:PAS domain S-box-containing protein
MRSGDADEQQLGGTAPQPEGADDAIQPDFRRLFESAPGPYLVLTKSFQIVAVTDTYLAATKTKRDEIVGRGLFEVFPDNPDDPEATGTSNLRDSLLTVLRDREPNTMAVQKYDIRKPESEGGGFEERYWSPRNSPVFNDQGDIDFIIHRVEDVTDFIRLKQGEAEQLKLTEEFRTRVVQMEGEVFARAQEVQKVNKQLQAAHDQVSELYEKAKELDELKTQFFANVSHELRTPLTLILAPTQKRLAEEDLLEEEKRVLETVERNAQLLLKHVNDLLDLARLEAGAMAMQYAEADLAKLSRLVASHFQTTAEDRHIDYEVETPEALPVQLDPEKVQRVLLNLISNALKFTPAGGFVKFTLTSDSSVATLTIADSGPGVPANMREAIFERFRQVDGNVTRKYGGTGLGLAIVKEFVSLHNGKVLIEEGTEGGAVFIVELPLAAPDGVSVEPQPTAPALPQLDLFPEETSLPNETHGSGGTESETDSLLPHILVVEDNPDMRAFLVETLRQKYRVVVAVDGADGLSKAIQYRPDLIISDMMMPQMSGDQMVKALRAREEFDGVPIVLLTAKADEALRVNLLKEDVQEYLYKPFSVDELFARVGRHLSERKRTEQTRSQLAAIVASSYDAIVSMTLEGIVTTWNPGAERLYGYAPEEIIGESISLLTTASRGEELAEALRAISKGQQIEDVHWLDHSKKRKRIDTSATISPLSSANGEVVGASIVARDVSAQKKAEDEVRRLNTDLELRVKQRTQEFEVANRELEAFSYSVSHDLRTPLRSIDGFSQALLEDQFDRLDDEGKDYLQRVRAAAKRMSNLIEDLLMLSRISRSEVHREQVDLSAVVQDIADNIQRQDPERKVEFVIQRGVTAEADGQLLRIAMENLMGNAWKFTNRVETARIEFGVIRDGEQPTYFIKDNGAGFDMAHSKQLFGAFQRLHSVDQFPGTGIGLATVQRVVRRHGGHIRGEGSVDGGASFFFTLEGE